MTDPIHGLTISCQSSTREALIGTMREMLDTLEFLFREGEADEGAVFSGGGPESNAHGIYSGPGDYRFDQDDDDGEDPDAGDDPGPQYWKALKDMGVEFHDAEKPLKQ